MAVTRVFTSDNCTPVSEPILAAINAANLGMAASYGLDDQTAQLERVASELFETEEKIFPVVTGTAANALALSQITPPYGGIYCHEAAHIMVDEAGAPEFFAGGAKLIGFPSPDGKITPQQIEQAVNYAREMGVHHVSPSAVSLCQTTEWGAVYALSEVAALCDVAHQHDLPVHTVLPKDTFGIAVNYALKHWEALPNFTKAGHHDASNNYAERGMRPVADGRKAFLFVGSERAGHAAAIYCSLVESCKANKVNPLTYLTYVLANARNKSIPLPTPDEFTVSNIAHVG